MKKGFTLIELLAVIVILAIIALIATPIILGIINDARKESNERSAELYASSVKNAIASYQLTHPNAPTKFTDLGVQYDGEVECAIEELYKDGSFYITDCTVNGAPVEYTYGRKRFEPQYYYYGFDFQGTVGEIAAPSNPSSVPPSGEVRYIGYDVMDGLVSTAYACFVRNGKEYCLKGYDTEAFNTNTDIIKEAYADAVDTNGCNFKTDNSRCNADSLSVYVGDEMQGVGAATAGIDCLITNTGYFGCV